MTGQPKKKLKEVEELADNCFTCALNACCVIPNHYVDRNRRHDPNDKIGHEYRNVYSIAMMLHIVSEKLENLLRVKNGLEQRQSRWEVARDRTEADKGDLEEQFEREAEQLKAGDTSVIGG